MLSLALRLLLAVAGQTCNGTTNSTTDAVGDTLSKVTELTLSLLALALLVLTDTLLLHALGADETTDELLSRTDGLVPRTLLAVWVVRSNTRGGNAVAADGCAGVRDIVLCVGNSLLVLSFSLAFVSHRLYALLGVAHLVLVATGQRADGGLDCARGRVHVGLKSGGVLVRHVD